jgi:serine/threonine protein kinase
MDLATGGDLRFHMCVKKTFTENQVKFFAACLIEALKYVHSKGYIHRDVKPENIVFEEKGYLRLTDFGISKRRKINNMKNTSGTPGYMAPEVLFHQNHSYEVDYFAMGVILYECLMGKRPYLGGS